MMVLYNPIDKSWLIENKELGLSGYDSTFKSALNSLSEGFDILITGIITFDNSKLSEDSKKIKHNLEKYVNFNELSTDEKMTFTPEELKRITICRNCDYSEKDEIFFGDNILFCTKVEMELGTDNIEETNIFDIKKCPLNKWEAK